MDINNEQEYMASQIAELENLVNQYRGDIEKLRTQVSSDAKKKYKDDSTKNRAQARIVSLQEQLKGAEENLVELKNTKRALDENKVTLETYKKKLESAERQLKEAKSAEKYAYNVETYNKVNQTIADLQAKVKKSVEEREGLTKFYKDRQKKYDETLDEMVRLKDGAFAVVDVKNLIYENVIFPKLKEKFPLVFSDSDTAKNVGVSKLARAVRASKKAEKKNKAQTSYANLVNEMAESYVTLRNTYEYNYAREGAEKFKTLEQELGAESSEQTIKKIINEKTSVKFTDLIIANKKVALAGITVAVLALGTILTVGGLFGGANSIIDKATGIISGNTLSTSQTTVVNNFASAEALTAVLKDEGKTQELNGGKAINYSVVDSKVSDLTELKENYNEFVTKNDINGAIKNYNEIKDDKGVSTFKKAEMAKPVVELSEKMADYAHESSQLVNDLSTATSIKVESLQKELDDLTEIVNVPTVSIEMADQFAKNKALFANPAKGGASLGITSCEYVKQTGKATAIVDCVDKKGNKYINVIEIQLDKNLLNVDADTILNELRNQNNKNVTMQVFDKELSFEVGGDSSEMGSGFDVEAGSIKYSTTESYNSKSDLTKITATAVVFGKDGMKTYKIEESYKGKVSAAEKENEIKRKLANVLGVTLEAENESEL